MKIDPKGIKDLLERLQQEKDEAIWGQDFERAAILRDKMDKIRERVAQAKKQAAVSDWVFVSKEEYSEEFGVLAAKMATLLKENATLIVEGRLLDLSYKILDEIVHQGQLCPRKSTTPEPVKGSEISNDPPIGMGR